jgi:hypothetical protein
MNNYEQYEVPNGVPVKMWTHGVPVEEDAKNQLRNIARLPIVFKHVAVMPDVHLGIGATIGSVVPTLKATRASRTRTTTSTWERWERATTSSKSAWTNTSPCG